MTVFQKIIRILFLPCLILVALLAMYTRTSELMTAVESGEVSRLLSPASALAEDNAAKTPTDVAPVAAADAKSEEAKPAPSSPQAAAGTDTKKAEMPSVVPKQRTEVASDTVLTDEDIEILQHLAERRKELDKRAQGVEQSEALLQAAEQRIDTKIAEMQKMRADLEKLLASADTQQSAQMKSLVKIYETMKPAQAAKIFEQLEMNMLLQVIQQMKEAKAAPVLAAMDPAKAKAVTAELIRRKDIQKEAAAVNSLSN